MSGKELFARTCQERNDLDARIQAMRNALLRLAHNWDGMSRSPWIEPSRQRVFAENSRALLEALNDSDCGLTP